MDLRVIGDEIHQARRSRGWTQGDLGRKVGVSQAHVSDIERGQASGAPGIVEKMCNELDIDFRQAVGRAFGVYSQAETAILNDPSLRAEDRQLLLLIHREMVKRGPLGGEIAS